MSCPRYPKYKPSGVKWLGDVPEGWSVGPLKRLITAQSGTDNKSETGDFPLYGANGVIGASDTASQAHGALLVGRVGSAGSITLAIESCAVSDNALIIRPVTNSERPYLFWLLSSLNLIADISKNAQPLITATALVSKSVAFPLSLPEQTAIAEFLDRETGKIDGLVAEQRRLMELLKEKIASLVLSSVDLPSTKRLRFRDAASIISRPVLQQQEESYTRIGLFNRGRGLFHKDASEMDDMGESDFFWIEEGDLIISGQFAWEGAVAMAGKDDTGCVVSHRYPVIHGVPGIAMTEYLFGLLCTNHGDFLLNEHSRGAAGRNRPLNIRSLMKELIPVPTMEIQKAVASAIHSRTALFKEISKAIDHLQERRSALISSAVTGQIDVRQHPKN